MEVSCASPSWGKTGIDSHIVDTRSHHSSCAQETMYHELFKSSVKTLLYLIHYLSCETLL